jgi:HSP20 family protein
MVGTLKPRFTVMLPPSVQREMDQVFDTFFGNGHGNGNGHTAGYSAPASLWEEEDRWCVEVDLPGVKQEDIDITLEKNTLRIAAERKGLEDRKYWHQERAYGRFERLFTLPETVNPDSIEAELREGVLYLTLAKRPESQPRKISVKAS